MTITTHAFRFAAAAAALTLAVAACGSTGPSTGSKAGSVTVWALQDDALNPVQKKEIKAYNTDAKAPAKIQIFVNDPYKQKLQTALGSPNAPDVFLNWGGGNLDGYVKAGDVADLTSMMSSNPDWKNTFLPSVLDGAKLHGKYYGVPMTGVQPVALFYNNDLFAKAGITAAPKTWQDLKADIGKLKAKGITPIALAGKQSWTELMWMEYLLDRVGGPSKFKAIQAGKPGAWRDPAVHKALTMIVDLVNSGAFGSNYGSVSQDNGGADALMAHGKAAMELMGSWEYSAQLASAPKFVKSGALKWTAFPSVPGGKGDTADIVGNPSNFYSITKKSKNIAAAKTFLRKTVTDPNYVKGLIGIGNVPAIKGVESQLKAAPHADYTMFIYDLVKNAPSFAQSWDQALTPADAQTMLTNLQKVFNKQQKPGQFISAMAAG